MANEQGVTDLNAILYDLEGTQKAEGRLAAFFESEAEAVRQWNTQRAGQARLRGGAQLGGGRSLLARCPETTRRRYETLLYFEERLPPNADHGYLIGPACQILESELDRLLLAPARGIAEGLIAALQRNGRDRSQAEILNKWATGQVPTTIGIGSLVLLALRRGQEQRLDSVREFLADRFEPGYETLLANKMLGQCLDAIRTRFRNPTCHATAVFDAEDYGEFVRLMVAHRRFTAWDSGGPETPDPAPDSGFFHHHLRQSRRPASEAAPDPAPPTVSATIRPLPEDPGPAEVFLSYASADRERVVALADRLAAAGVSVWLDRHKIEGASLWAEEIVRAIRACKVVVLMCSDASMRSWAVKQEIQLAGERQKVLLPVLLSQVSFPEQVEFFLAGRQWIEAADGPPERWFPQMLRALALAGVRHTNAGPGLPPAGPVPDVEPLRLDWSLEGLRALARFTDQIWPVPADRVPRGMTRSGLRGLGAPQDDVEHGYRLGSRLRLAIESEHDGHLLLLDEGPEGILYCLCPSQFAPDTALPRGRNVLPQGRSRYDSFELTGQPGREQLLAIVTDRPLGLDWKPHDPRIPARVLSRDDIDTMLNLLKNLPGNRWTALATYFDVVE